MILPDTYNQADSNCFYVTLGGNHYLLCNAYYGTAAARLGGPLDLNAQPVMGEKIHITGNVVIQEAQIGDKTFLLCTGYASQGMTQVQNPREPGAGLQEYSEWVNVGDYISLMTFKWDGELFAVAETSQGIGITHIPNPQNNGEGLKELGSWSTEGGNLTQGILGVSKDTVHIKLVEYNGHTFVVADGTKGNGIAYLPNPKNDGSGLVVEEDFHPVQGGFNSEDAPYVKKIIVNGNPLYIVLGNSGYDIVNAGDIASPLPSST